MRYSLLASALLLWAAAATADIGTVTVPIAMLHAPASGLGYCGKVEYTLQAGTYDSVLVALSIVPVAGGTPLALDEVAGDVGLIRIIDSTAAEKKEIFFQCKGNPGPGAYYASITANAQTSASRQWIENKLNSMTKYDKSVLLGGTNGGFETGSAGGIPAIYASDGPHGVMKSLGQATLFPCLSAVAAAWDTALSDTMGIAKGREFRAKGRNCSLGPALNLVYHPQLGRAFEYYSEDPYLSGKMAAADTRGLQSAGVIACVKHYSLNNKEFDRYSMSAQIDERSLQEIFLPNFRRSLLEGSALSLMVAWGSINGNYEPSYKYTMTDVLRKTWGWQGFSMTDWAASTKDFPTAANWGVDMRMPYQYDYTPANFATMPDSIVNMHARRVIRAQKLIGALETGYSRTAYTTYLLSSEHRRIARLIGAKSIVLARNTGNILPLPKTGARIALTGPYATTCRLGGGGSSGVGPAIQINPSQGIRELLASVGAGASTIVTDINQADYIVVFVGISGETEGADRGALGLTDGNSDVAAALVAKPTKTIVVYTGGSASTPGTWSTAPAIVIAFYPGQEQGYCIADVLFGNANPCGKLAVTFPNDATQPADFQYHTTTTNNETLIYSRADTAYGYFRVNKRGVSPLFNFGHGLSYTTFSYSNLSINPGSIVVGDRVLVQVDITNTGARAGEEVVQLYLTMPGDKGVPVRVQDLRGFKKVALQAGETKKLTFTLTFDDMAYFDVGAAEWDGDGRFKVLPGVFTVRVGTSSEITRQPTVSSSFTVQ